MHEASHYGFFLTNGLEKSMAAERKNELGSIFERNAFTQFSYKGPSQMAMDEDSMRSYLQSNSSSTRMRGTTLVPKFGLHDFNRFFLKELLPPKPSGTNPNDMSLR